MYHVVAKNLVYSVVTPYVHAPISIPYIHSAFDPSPLVEELQTRGFVVHGKRFKVKNILGMARQAFVSTANESAIMLALMKIPKEDVVSHGRNVHVAMAYREFLNICGLLTIKKIEPPTYDFLQLMKMSIPRGKKAGFSQPPSMRMGTEWTDTPNYKEDVFLYTGLLVGHCFEKAKCTFNPSWSRDLNVKAVYSIVKANLSDALAKQSAKPEIRQPGDDPEKARIFYQLSMQHYIIARVLCEPFHEYILMRGFCALGFRWLGGGAEKLWRFMRGSDAGREFGCLDVSGKDRNFKAQDIADGVALQETIYRRSNTWQSVLTTALFMWLIQNTAYHTVNWPGGFRFVIGLLFSGDYNTSVLNSIHLCMLFIAYIIKMSVTYRQLWGAWRDGRARAMVQGDDVIVSFGKDVRDLINTKGFIAFLESHGQLIKPESVAIADRLDSDFDLHGRLRTPRDKAIVFLKRYLFREPNKNLVYPVRPTCDYVYRLVTTTSSLDTPALYFSKLVGLLLDTMGTNPFAYSMLLTLCSIVYERYNGPAFQREFEEKMGEEEFTRSRLYKMGLEGVSPSTILEMVRNRGVLFDRIVGREVTIIEATFDLNETQYRPMLPNRY